MTKYNNFMSVTKKVFAALVLLFLTIALLEIMKVTHFFNKSDSKPASTVPNLQTGSSKLPGASSADSPSTQSGPETNTENQGNTSSAELASPSGSFVSNHKPNLSGRPAPNQEESVCITTPGAQCEIIFTKDGVTKTLPTKTVGANGSASWEWTLQEIGLTEGNWQVAARATSGSQVKTTTDSLLLEVRP